MEFKAIATLNEYLNKASSDRRLALDHGEIGRALLVLGTNRGLAWMEKHIESSIGPQWGRILHDLQPPWAQLERWIRLSKIHCLAAIDALLVYAAADSLLREDEPAVLPEGASASSIHSSLNVALAKYGNPRIESAVKKLRHAFPIGTRPKRLVKVPSEIEQIAGIMFRHDSSKIPAWHDVLATAIDDRDSILDWLHSLMNFADKANAVAIVDSREWPDEIVLRVRDLPESRELGIQWETLSTDGKTTEELLCSLSELISSCGHKLVSFDVGDSDYSFAVVSSDDYQRLKTIFASLRDSGVSIKEC